jgi:hypothetical protein
MYVELRIPPTPEGNYPLDKNHNHMWPRPGFQMQGFPTLDGGIVLNLFIPKVGEGISVESLKDDDKFIKFFKE